MKLDLSDRFIAGLKPGDKPADYFDSKCRGLNLRVMPSGLKSWSVMFTDPSTGKRARLSLGTYPATPLAAARTRAVEARGMVESGCDPRVWKDASKSGPMSVTDLAKVYLEMHASKLRTFDAIKQTLKVNILPIIGDMPLADLHRRDIHRVTDPIKQRGSPSMALKTFQRLSAMLNFAVERGDMDSNPCFRMKMEGHSKPSERFLSAEEIAALWPALSSCFKPQMAMGLKFALITGQRIGEIARMDFGEIDLNKRIWTIPAEHSKNKYAHQVPLSDMAMELIEQALDNVIGPFNFTTAQIDQFLRRRLPKLPVQDWSAHVLRRTVATHLGELGFSPLVIGHVLNHRGTTKSGITLQAYNHYNYTREKQEALDTWAKRLSGIVSGKKVATFPKLTNHR